MALSALHLLAAVVSTLLSSYTWSWELARRLLLFEASHVFRTPLGKKPGTVVV
jgi:hypothetical protein